MVLEALSNVVAIWQLRRSVSGGQMHASGLVTRFFRFWWSYRVEMAAFWGTYWFLFALTMVLGSHLGGPLVRRQFEEAEWFPALRTVGLPTEEIGIDTLGTARLWRDIQQASALRAQYSAAWREGGEIGA